MFLIPKTVTQDIDRILKGFLWCKGKLRNGSAKVAWSSVCRPKCEGGLGLRLLSNWNEALLIKNLWNIAASKDSLWVKWVNIVKLKRKSIWDVQKKYNDGWIWKVLLDLRDKIKDHVCNDNNGHAVWKDSSGKIVDYSTKTVYNTLSQPGSTVRWYKVVWFSQCNPRMAFILWMAMKCKLQTQDRIRKWNNDPNMKCSLCNEVQDSHNQLFFECKYSKYIWSSLKKKMRKAWLTDSHSWDNVKEQFANAPCNNNIDSVLARITLATTVYHIWKERNTRIFTGEAVDEQVLLSIIVEKVKLQLLSLTVRKSPNTVKVAEEWEVVFKTPSHGA